MKFSMQAKLVFVLLIAVLLLSACEIPVGGNTAARKPNFIVILTDDLDTSLMPVMINTKELVTDRGADFTNYFITSPYCCPARSSYYRGQYAHNTGILVNTPGFIQFQKDGLEKETLAVWLQRAGYQTSLIGKYFVSYPGQLHKSYLPPGWTDWHGLINEDVANKFIKSDSGYYYNYVLNENGVTNIYGHAEADYTTDVFNRLSQQFINSSIDAYQPFFLWVGIKAPHDPAIPAPRHENSLPDLVYPAKPSTLEADISDKPGLMMERSTVSGDTTTTAEINSVYRQHALTMLSVDEMVADLVALLDSRGELDNTYIIITSDNGFHYGEHGLAFGKGLPYLEDTRVPMVMRGPGIPEGLVIDELTANIDLVPTIAELAGIRAKNFVDGRSWVPLFASDPTVDWRQALLIEIGNLDFSKPSPIVYRGIRGKDSLYVEYLDNDRKELEYYNLQQDPYEMENKAASLTDMDLDQLHTLLEQLMACKSKDCRIVDLQAPGIY
jgi:arylsulfatase A-like enzyme